MSFLPSKSNRIQRAPAMQPRSIASDIEKAEGVPGIIALLIIAEAAPSFHKPLAHRDPHRSSQGSALAVITDNSERALPRASNSTPLVAPAKAAAANTSVVFPDPYVPTTAVTLDA